MSADFPSTRDLVAYTWEPLTGTATFLYERGLLRKTVVREQRRHALSIGHVGVRH